MENKELYKKATKLSAVVADLIREVETLENKLIWSEWRCEKLSKEILRLKETE